MRKSDVFPTKYLSAGDLAGKPHVLEITRAPLETLKPNGSEQAKIVLYFRDAKKSLPLNKTNFDAVADCAGTDETDNWPGVRVEVFPTTTEMQGKTVACIRIRKPRELPLAPSKAPAAPPPSIDDEIPF